MTPAHQDAMHPYMQASLIALAILAWCWIGSAFVNWVLPVGGM